MTDNRTTELIPCPWCGVDMKLHTINYPWADGDPSWYILHEDMAEAIRRKCPMEMGGYDTREEAIAAWNTRAELGSGTCHAIAIYNMHDEWFCDSCSACGYEWYEDEPNYCPNCGKRVSA